MGIDPSLKSTGVAVICDSGVYLFKVENDGVHRSFNDCVHRADVIFAEIKGVLYSLGCEGVCCVGVETHAFRGFSHKLLVVDSVLCVKLCSLGEVFTFRTNYLNLSIAGVANCRKKQGVNIKGLTGDVFYRLKSVFELRGRSFYKRVKSGAGYLWKSDDKFGDDMRDAFLLATRMVVREDPLGDLAQDVLDVCKAYGREYEEKVILL